MSKRTATEAQSAESSENKKPFRAGSKAENDDDMGEFEDGWEDEFESDEEVVDGANNDGVYALQIVPEQSIYYARFRYGS